VARGTQHRKRRPRPNARVASAPAKSKPKTVKHERWEDQLFFGRLRVHAKWVFVLLAFVFALGFVIFGVGSGSTGISDVLQNFFKGSGSSGTSLSSLRNNAAKHPQQAKAWRDLATKLEADGKLDDAIVALTRYTALKPKDEAGLEDLASVYIRRATDAQQQYFAAQTQSQVLAPTSPGTPAATSAIGKALASVSNPIDSAVTSVVGVSSSDAYTKIIQYQKDAVGTYQKLAKLSPKDATTQFRLAQIAQGAGDVSTAISAYKRFLALAPDDPLAATAKKSLKQLQGQK
jgi:tetratricopeptide (TPR) repeat protein